MLVTNGCGSSKKEQKHPETLSWSDKGKKTCGEAKNRRKKKRQNEFLRSKECIHRKYKEY